MKCLEEKDHLVNLIVTIRVSAKFDIVLLQLMIGVHNHKVYYL